MCCHLLLSGRGESWTFSKCAPAVNDIFWHRVNPNRAHLLKATATLAGLESKQFKLALSALHRIHTFLNGKFTIGEVRPFDRSMIGDFEGITAATRIVTPIVNTCWSPLPGPVNSKVDPEGVLQSLINKGTCKYTEDNDILYEEYVSGGTSESVFPSFILQRISTEVSTRSIKVDAVNPAAFRQGQLIEMSFNIRVLKVGDTRIVINRLDHLVIFARKGAEARFFFFFCVEGSRTHINKCS